MPGNSGVNPGLARSGEGDGDGQEATGDRVPGKAASPGEPESENLSAQMYVTALATRVQRT
jgi:hypothetical protein